MERSLLTIIALLLAGESLALFFGVALPGSAAGGDQAWASPRNILFLGLDALTGALLLIFVARLGPLMSPLIVVAMLGLALITHAVREVEYWVGAADAFCFNRPLELLNLLKLGLIGLAIFIGDRE